LTIFQTQAFAELVGLCQFNPVQFILYFLQGPYRIRFIRCRCNIHPAIGMSIIPGYTPAFGVHHTQTILGLSVTMPCRLLVPLTGGNIILFHAKTFRIKITETILGLGVILFRSIAKPDECFVSIGRETKSIHIDFADLILRLGISLCRSLQK